MIDFVAFDVETANPDLASICQIGIVCFSNGKIVDRWQTLIDPEDEFDEMNESIHGITQRMVEGSPTFPLVADRLRRMLGGNIVASHTAFDKAALGQSIVRYKINPVQCTWIDTARVARRAWSEIAYRGYGLRCVSDLLGIEFKHHEAIEDARACGEILLRAMAETGLTLDDWLVRVNRPITEKSKEIAREGNPEGPLHGEVIVFTGALSMPRSKAAELAASAGCDVKDSVGKATTLLVVGDQDVRKLVGHEKSSKHRKAEELICKGQPLRILRESDFMHIIGM